MRHFDEIFAMAEGHKGGSEAVEALLPKPKSKAALTRLGDDRWLAGLTRSVFQAGFNWKVIASKWDGFEEAFEGFEPRRWAMMSDEDLDRLISDTRIVRHGKKISSVQGNAAMLVELAAKHGSAAKAFAEWPSTEYIGLLDYLKRNGSRLGGSTAQYCLRAMGKDGFILTPDVTAALIREGVVDKAPTSKGALKAVQAAFDTWCGESGRSLSEVSRLLALSVGP